ncbi:MAG TPA: response regulator [Terriglobales bacterium]|nr:response regulator [Terriglobales bacterium]
MQSILLVEDSKFLRVATERTLSRAGYQVATASDGEEALRMAIKLVPDVVLLDMLLPKLAGLEVLQELKHNPATANVPIIVLSSLSDKNEAKLKSDGAAAYFEKSKLDAKHGSQALLDTIKETLAKSR